MNEPISIPAKTFHGAAIDADGFSASISAENVARQNAISEVCLEGGAYEGIIVGEYRKLISCENYGELTGCYATIILSSANIVCRSLLPSNR